MSRRHPGLSLRACFASSSTAPCLRGVRCVCVRVCFLHILKAVTLVFYHSFSSMTSQKGFKYSSTPPGVLVGGGVA
nr:MAG TPA: hypothetical protein [Caudoviricetes sp.]